MKQEFTLERAWQQYSEMVIIKSGMPREWLAIMKPVFYGGAAAGALIGDTDELRDDVMNGFMEGGDFPCH